MYEGGGGGQIKRNDRAMRNFRCLVDRAVTLVLTKACIYGAGYPGQGEGRSKTSDSYIVAIYDIL